MTEQKEKKIQELEQRLEQLEEQQQGGVKLSRRQALGAGALGLGGLLGGAGALGSSGTAQAQTDGNAIFGIDQIGLEDDRVDTLYVNELDNQTESGTFESVTTEEAEIDDRNVLRRNTERQTVYVSEEGSDDAEGTEDDPLATVQE